MPVSVGAVRYGPGRGALRRFPVRSSWRQLRIPRDRDEEDLLLGVFVETLYCVVMSLIPYLSNVAYVVLITIGEKPQIQAAAVKQGAML